MLSVLEKQVTSTPITMYWVYWLPVFPVLIIRKQKPAIYVNMVNNFYGTRKSNHFWAMVFLKYMRQIGIHLLFEYAYDMCYDKAQVLDITVHI